MTVDWVVVLFEMINFGVLVAILTRFVVRPLGRVLEQRRVELTERDAQTRIREQQAAAARQEFERELQRIDTIADERIAAALAEAQTQADAIVAEARELARGTLAKTELELDQTRRHALEQFRRELMVLGVDAARRVIRELGAPELGLAFVRRGLHALADHREPASIRRIQIHVSPELDLAEVAELVQRELPNTRFEIDVDGSLIAGARMVSEGHEVAASAGASLELWYRGLLDAGVATS